MNVEQLVAEINRLLQEGKIAHDTPVHIACRRAGDAGLAEVEYGPDWLDLVPDAPLVREMN